MAVSRFLRRLMPPLPYADIPRPERQVAVIGDIHGRADLLERALQRLAAQPGAADMRVILVGDLMDRGPDSAAVLLRVIGLQADPAPFAEVICLMGNHERMLLDFLADPVLAGPHWLAHGGDATLSAFGIDVHGGNGGGHAGEHGGGDTGEARTAEDRLHHLREAFCQIVPDSVTAWIDALPLLWREGDLVVSHAGADPRRAMADQTAADLLWGHREFRTRMRTDGLWIVHGHFIVPEPSAREGRIAVDTGAWQSNLLTAAVLGPAGLRFLITPAAGMGDVPPQAEPFF